MMSKFRIQMARQFGEKIAKEHGFDAFPIDPKKVAAKADIEIVAKPPDRKGVSGGILFQGNAVTIFYATDIDNDGFKRFTLGHELGHYFLPGHPEEIQKTAAIHLSRAGFSEGSKSIEIEADHFSSGLLMPGSLVRKVLDRGSVGLDGILRLADEAECSRTASAIRAAECSPYPVAVIVSQADRIAYGFFSDGFKKLKPEQFPRKGTPLPAGRTRIFNENPHNIFSAERACGRTILSDWFGGPSLELDEEIIGLGRYGYSLTVLTSEALPLNPDEEEDEDERLIESWTPRFAYGR